MPIDVPLQLRNALLSGKCVLFVGAGIGGCITGPDGQPLPDARALARQMLKDFGLSQFDSDDLASVAQLVEMKRGRKELDAYVSKRFTNSTPDEHVEWIATIPWKAIFTTNYDDGVERAYATNSHIRQTPISVSATSDITDWDRRLHVPVFHLHGLAAAPERSRIIITQDDYLQYSRKKRMLFELLKQEFATSTILYLGYSNRDPNWRELHANVAEEFLPATPPPAYRVVIAPDALESEILAGRGVVTVSGSVEDFVDSVRTFTATATFDTDHIENLRRGVPADLLRSFEESPAPTARLIQNWTYLNQTTIEEKSNVDEFLRGDRANWALISARDYFKRDIEDVVFDDVLDFATSSRSTTAVSIVLGPAGYGVSTLLMSLALRATMENAGRVFVLRPNAQLHPGDIDFATGLSDAPTFFIVDEAAAVAADLATSINLCRQSKRAAFFLCGDRLNEWRQARPSVRGREHQIDSLSDGEIERLLDFLDKYSALGALEHLPHDFQIATIKQKYDKQLLVILREATEGRGFDAIIEDEFWHLGSDLARRLYALVACFYHLRVPVRDQLLAKLLGVDLSALYKITSAPTEGVIHYDCVNEEKGEYAARARHQAIAEIVWARCVSDPERDTLLLRALDNLNLNYSLDARVFDAFVRSDRDIDYLASLDSKTRFFETACRMDPDSPYVRQHYARMLLRERRPELALSQIEMAIGRNPTLRVLHHTKGEVLKQLVTMTASTEKARKYLVRAETAYKQAQSLASRDPYPWQGLADLYFEWAKRAESDDEGADYLAKTQDIITRGLLEVRDKEGLWIISSRIQDWLGDKPAAMAALAKAAEHAPDGSVSRYLLGRTCFRRREYQKVIDTLAPLIKANPNQYQACLLYAESLLALGKSRDEAIAVLQLGNLYGLRDPRYVATLGGLLVLNGELSEADAVFERGRAMEFGVEELRMNQYVPTSVNGDQLTLEGVVVHVTGGYTWISVAGLPDFWAFGSKFGGVAAVKGLRVRFTPAFSARGTVALFVSPA